MQHVASMVVVVPIRRSRASCYAYTLLALVVSACEGGNFFSSGNTCSVRTEDELQALAADSELDCNLSVIETDLVSLDKLAGVTRIPSILLKDNASLVDVTALNGLESEFELTVLDTPLAEDQQWPERLSYGFLERVDSVSISGVPTAARAILLLENSRLSDVDFPQLESADELLFGNLPELEGLLDAFPVLSSVGTLSVRDCPLITVAEIDELALRANVDAESLTHCGNLDDGVCP